MQKNQCKVFRRTLRACQNENKIESHLPEETLTAQKVSDVVLLYTLLLNTCAVIVDSSFFLTNPEYISASW